MPLPSHANLTGHFDASDTDFLWRTINGGGSGVHTDHPADGEAVSAWDDEGDGISNILFRQLSSSQPDFRSGTPLMRSPCLDFNGSTDMLSFYDQIANGGRSAGDLLGASGKTIICSFYPESIVGNDADPAVNKCLIADTFGNVGIYTKDASGTKKVGIFNRDSGGRDSVETVIAEGRSWIAAYRHDGTDLKLRVVDDTGSATNVSTTSGASVDLSNNLQLGTGWPFTTTFWNGRIGEVAFYNAALSDADLDAAVAYFTAKWMGIGGGGLIPRIRHHLLQQGMASRVFTSGIFG